MKAPRYGGLVFLLFAIGHDGSGDFSSGFNAGLGGFYSELGRFGGDFHGHRDGASGDEGEAEGKGEHLKGAFHREVYRWLRTGLRELGFN